MRLSHFFIDRPVFAFVISILITLVGALAFPTLPVAQYPTIAPPTITVSAQFPGANAETLSSLVATPLEEAINGVENMLYMSASSTSDGRVNVTVTFTGGTELNAAQVLVQNRVQTVLPQLPSEVQRFGLTVRKAGQDILMFVHVYSPDGSLDQSYVSNYVTLRLLSPLLRLQGVGDIQIRGARDYAMRIWIDPDKAAARNLTADEIVAGLRSHNVDVATGSVGAPPFGNAPAPAYQLAVQAQGRLQSPEEFANVVLRREASGATVKVSDVARVELGSADYNANSYLSRRTAVAVPIQAQPGANALETANAVKAEMKRLKADFPAGLDYSITYNPTDFVQASVEEVQKALFEALVLVVLVVIVFLQSWRAALIPIVAIPISLIGTMATLKLFGFSLNTLSLFALVLAIGIVVDDAIVVVESVERNMRLGLDPREAAHRTMDEVGGALVAIALVLMAVFVPTAFIPGISGQFYQQFALTIASATLISLVVSQTLSPALAALIMRPHRGDHEGRPDWKRPLQAFPLWFNQGFDKISARYSGWTKRLVRTAVLMLVIYAGLIALTGWRVAATPTGFIPAQDQGSMICVVTLPPGSSLARTDAVIRRINEKVLALPGVKATSVVAGVDFTIGASNPATASAFVVLQPDAERRKHGLTVAKVLASARKAVADEQGATVRFVQPPAVRGIGSAGGFKMVIEDQSGRGYRALEQATDALAAAARSDKAVTGVFSAFNTKTPQLYANIDREKADTLGVPTGAILSTMQTYLGSTFINNFSYLGRTFRVTAHAEGEARALERDIGRLQTRSASGVMTPLSAVMDIERRTGPFRTVTYNVYPAAELNGDTPPGASTGQTLNAMAALAKRTLPEGFGFEWTELAYQQQLAGNTGTLVFGLAVIFVFLLLAALYESVTLPLAVILIVPMCLLAAFVGVGLRGQDNNILTQIGLVVLVGLAAKNAILIVEFARQGELEHGMDRFAAAEAAAHVRLRPILMTSFAFILGVVPLAFASGAGAEMRIALGTAVFFGMIGVTFFGLVFTPVFYVVTRRLSALLPQPPRPHSAMPTTGEPPRDTGEEPAA